MFTSDDYFHITNSRILNENVNHLDERKYEPDEKLPGSGKTPSEKMEKKRAQHGARVRLGNPALGRSRRSDPESDSYTERAFTMDVVKSAQDKGEEPSKDPGWKNLIKARRRPRASYEKPNERPGGLRAKATKAGGYRTLTRKEEFDNLTEKNIHEPSEAEQFSQSDAIAKNPRVRAERAAAAAAAKKAAQAKLNSQGLKRKDGTPVFEEVVEYLFVEGYADTIESAELIAENISASWVNEILDEKYVKALDTTGRGADHRTRFPKFHTWDKDPEVDPKFTRRRARTNDKKIDPYFSGRRERKDERRQRVGGFSEAMSNRPEEPSHGRYPDSNKIDLAQQNARDRFNKQKEIEAKWAKKDKKENI